MNIECQKDKLSEVISRIEKITNKNTPLPSLSCILLVAKDKNLICKATNLEIGVEITIPAKVNKDGIVAIPANVLSQTIFNIYGGKVISLEEKDGILTIKNDLAEVKLKTLSYQEFPLIPRPEEEKSNPLKIKEIIDGIKAVIFCASPSSIKPELGSVYIYPENQSLIFVATDSFRLAEKRIVSKQAENILPLLIPQKNCAELIRIFDGVSEEGVIVLGKNQISISTPSIYFTSRVVDGSFPDYKQIIPKQNEANIHCLKEDLLDGLKTLSVVFDKFNQVTFSVDVKKGALTLTSKNNDVGEGMSQVKIKGEGENVTVSFNQSYIRDAFLGLVDDSVKLAFGGAHKPLLIEGGGNSNFRYLVMPMNR